ncbi:zf-UBP domain-containing protein [Cephalotus follicularis]|uniref:Zf-UBP domain-containing protein n=1 Tax=Cephalotus follicularis TaxID=3775 RepID=A0A1Q3B300_CEPFO|nr:zf-UBP domain-containing protein [Cephalotus follicularis]
MANQVSSSSNPSEFKIEEEEEDELIYDGAESGWVEARTWCDHLASLSSDLSHIPTPLTPCHSCQHPSENWLCLFCKDVLCSRFVNKHMLHHYHHTNHCLALSYSDLSVWCFSCDAYLDAQVIPELRPVHEIAYILKFGEAPPFRTPEHSLPQGSSSSSAS